MVVFGVLVFLFYIQGNFIVYGQFECIGTCYSGRLSPKKENIYQDKFVRGYSYKNLTNTSDQKCYSACKHDCRCKACQIKDGKCELLDADIKSLCKLDLHDGPGYVFYDLEQTQFQGKSHMLPPNVCHNGCCRSQPCQNGGTCHETCQNPKQKFTCRCRGIYSGTVCERKVSSCQEIAKNNGTLSHGMHTIYRMDTGAALTVYCDFTTPDQAWTLIESFSYENNGIYKDKPFVFDFPRNIEPDKFIWGDYRLPLATMKYLGLTSAQFRATCRFFTRAGGSLKRDSLLGSLKDYDIINNGSFEGCVTYRYINIRDQEYFNQSALTFSLSSKKIHLHVEPSAACGFVVPDKAEGEEFFGFYNPPNPTFSCVSVTRSTTQWWLGGEIPICLYSQIIGEVES